MNLHDLNGNITGLNGYITGLYSNITGLNGNITHFQKSKRNNTFSIGVITRSERTLQRYFFHIKDN